MSILGMDVGSRCIKLVEMTGGRKPQVLRAFLLDTPAGAVVDGEIRNMEAVVATLQDAVKVHRIKHRELHVSIQSSQMSSRDIKLPTLRREEIVPAVEFELAQSFPGIMQTHTLSYLQYSKIGTPVSGISVICPTRILDGYVELAKQLGFPLVRIDASFNAVTRALASFNLLRITDDTVMVVEIGSATSQVSIISKGKLLLSRSVGAGATQVDEIMVSRFGVTSAQAEKVRREGSYKEFDVKEEEIGSVIRLGYSAVEDMIRQTLDFYRFNKSQEPPIQRIYLTGGGSFFNGLDTYLHEVFSLPVEPLKSSVRGIPQVYKSDLFLAAMGAGLTSKVLVEDINLIPNLRSLASARVKGGKRYIAYWIGGVLVVVALAIYGYIWWIEGFETSRSANLSEQAAQYASVNGVKSDIVQTRKRFDGMQAVLAAAKSSAFVQTALLDTLTANMPEGLFVQNYAAIGKSELKMSGVAQKRDDIAVLLNRLKALESVKEARVETVSTRLGMDGIAIDYNFTLSAIMKQ